MNNLPKVSIIMGAYNAEKTIENCIQSVLNQTYSNWEFIICNDCSSDRTLEVLERFATEDERIIVLNNESNLRLARSLNRCLSVATGEYVARMDADDEALPERLEKQVKFLAEHPEYAVVGSNMILFDETGEKGIRKVTEYPDKSLLLYDTPFAHPTIMMRKSVYDSLGGYTTDKKVVRAQDLELWFRFYHAGYTGYNMQEPLHRYREDVHDYKKRNLKAAIVIMKIFWNGYRLINIPWYKRFMAVKPVVSALLPGKLIAWYHAKRVSK